MICQNKLHMFTLQYTWNTLPMQFVCWWCNFFIILRRSNHCTLPPKTWQKIHNDLSEKASYIYSEIYFEYTTRAICLLVMQLFYNTPPVQPPHIASTHIAKKLLCICTLQGRLLRHLSFVAVVHHSFTEINLYCSLRTIQYQKYLRAKLSKRCCMQVYRPISVLKNSRQNHYKTQIFCPYYCKCC